MPRSVLFPARRRSSRVSMLLAACALSAAGGACAQGSVPYMPGTTARHAIQWLSDDAGLALNTTQWPLPAAAVQAALDALPATLNRNQQAARDVVQADLRQRLGAEFGLRAATRQPSLVAYGDEAVPGSSMSLRSPGWRLADGRAVVQLGARLEAPPVIGDVPAGTTSRSSVQFRLDDSAAVAEWGGVNLQAWSRRSWWGPGWQNSLILGNNAPALKGVGIQRAAGGASSSAWLSWLGPWNAEFFIAQIEGQAAPANPLLIGNRLTLRPWQGVELGLTRTAQWGGSGRPQNLSSFMAMLTGSGTNADTAAQRARDPGNQMAGFDLRARCPLGWRCAGYTQLIGEDMAGMWPSKYLSLFGLERWTSDGSQRYFAEYVHSSCGTTPGGERALRCAYRNGQYPEGYASERRWLGAGVGPDARVLTLGWLHAGSASSLRLNVGRIDGLALADSASQPGAVAPFVGGRLARLRALQWQREWSLAGGVLTPQLGWQRLTGGDWADNSVQLGLQWRISLDAGGAAGAGRGAAVAAEAPSGS
jgi:Capsule assembly protein Wzi